MGWRYERGKVLRVHPFIYRKQLKDSGVIIMPYLYFILRSCWMSIRGGEAWFFGTQVLVLVVVSLRACRPSSLAR